jgi:hypothetical protein
MHAERPIGVRWTLGDVGERGFEALRLSIWGARRVFGPEAAYAVCVNTISLARAQAKTGEVPSGVIWHEATRDFPVFLRRHFGPGMAEGVGWKLAPMRFFPDYYELSLDNDCILWELPQALRRWLAGDDPASCVMTEDVVACFGQFEELCGTEPRNAGLRGLPPGFDLERALRQVLEARPVRMTSEVDEQGLQTAALARSGPLRVVSLDDLSICSPFYPHLPHLGRCGAHFVGLNARHIPWSYFDRPADDCMTEHWQRHRPTLYEKVGLDFTAAE